MGQSQRNNFVLVYHPIENFFLKSDQKSAKRMTEGAVAESEVILKHLEQMNNEEDIIAKDRGSIQKEQEVFQCLLQG